jgi:hypothetical protein
MRKFIAIFAFIILPFHSFAVNHTVDKTDFIKAIIEDNHKVLLITRPPNWGKSSILMELEKFFTPNIKTDCSCNHIIEQYKEQSLYGKTIHEHKELLDKYFGKYPTILISLKISKTDTIESLHKSINSTIKHLYRKYPYLAKSPNLNIEEINLYNKYADNLQPLTKEEMILSLRFLEDIFNKHFGKQTIILVDEYDYLVNQYYIQQFSEHGLREKESPVLLEIYDLVGKMLAKAVRNNQSLHKAIFTGTTNIEKMGIFTGLKSFREDSVLNPYLKKYFGFTDEEVIDLLKQANIYYDHKVLASIKSWYGGYRIGDVDIYNPTSIMKMINGYKKKQDLVLTHVRYMSLKSDFSSPRRQKELVALLEGRGIEIEADPYVEFWEINSKSDSFYTLLLYEGFLAARNIQKAPNGTYKCTVKIPNKEYREIFERARIVGTISGQ